MNMLPCLIVLTVAGRIYNRIILENDVSMGNVWQGFPDEAWTTIRMSSEMIFRKSNFYRFVLCLWWNGACAFALRLRTAQLIKRIYKKLSAWLH